MSMQVSDARILLLEDDADTRVNLNDILVDQGYEVESLSMLAELESRTDLSNYHVLLLDRRLPDGDAASVLTTIRRQAPEIGILIITALTDLSGAIMAVREGAEDYLIKPIDVVDLLGSIQRVLERQHLRREKERNESRFRQLVETADSAILLLGPDDRVEYANPFAVSQLVGPSWEPVHGRLHDYFASESDCSIWTDAERQARQAIAVRGVEVSFKPDASPVRSWLWNFNVLPLEPGLLLAIGHDITEVKSAQERALQSARLAAIGQMVTGLAHESRNALQRSQACLEMLAMEVEDLQPALNLVTRIQKAQDDLALLYEEVRDYAAPIPLDRQAQDLVSLVDQAWTHLALDRLQKKVDLLHEPGECDCVGFVDRFRIEQVFRNVLDNAIAACPNPGRIRVEWRDETLGRRRYTRVSIIDNGPGLTEEVRARIFEPFFTTKTHGTGLGMAIVKRIVEAHGGMVDVSSLVGGGAVMSLVLPKGLF